MKIVTTAAAATVAALLTPMTASAQRGGADRPGGSYAQTCSDIAVSGGRLYAECRDTRRGTRTSSLDINGCNRRDIANDDGLLVCGDQRGRFESNTRGDRGGNGGGWGGNDGGPNGGGWGGHGGGSITVYRDAGFRGPSRTFTGEVGNLGRTGFNDAISAMQMRGRWEVCEDSGFRGRCMEFDGDVSNLRRSGLNDRISSLRPLRGGRR